jgi:cation diffusion facilitator CzcD-associated flavoprotein CzcO
METTKDVLVVGAGPAGLACAAQLRRAGIPATVLERADTLAAPWRGHYDGLRLNTSRWFSHLPGQRFPRRAGVFPARDDVVAYLECYAAHHNLDIRFGVQVNRLEPGGRDGQDRPHWTVTTTSYGVLAASHVVVATGLLQIPYLPDWPGRDRYAGTLMAAADYRDPTAFQGRDVLVAGAGSSGMEIAAGLAAAGARRIHLAVRTPPNILLRSIAGLPGDPAAMILLHLPPRTADRQIARIRRGTVRDLSAYGLPMPEEGPFQRLARTGDAPAVVDRAVLRSIRSGRVRVVAGVSALDSTGACLSDRSHVAVDAIIAATGYRTGLAPLVGHLGVLDDRGRPGHLGGEEATPGLHFAGFRPQPGQLGSFGREARRIATAVSTKQRSL